MSELALVNNVGRINALPRNASPYVVMGLPEGASRDQIRDKYLELSRKVHPDRAGNRGTRASARLQGAYDALTGGPLPGVPAAFNAAANARNRAAAQAEYNRVRARAAANPPDAPQHIQLPPGAEFVYLQNPDGQIVGPVNAIYDRARRYWTKEEINAWLCEESASRAKGREPRRMFKKVQPLFTEGPWRYQEFPVPEATPSGGCTIMGGKRTRRFKGKSKRTRKVKRTKRSP